MSLLTLSATGHARFDRLCRLVAERTTGRGITLAQLGDAHALARALDAEAVDRERVEALAVRLELSAGELAEVES